MKKTIVLYRPPRKRSRAGRPRWIGFAELYKNPAINAAVTLAEPLRVGLVIALVSADVVSRRRKGTAEGARVAGGTQVSA